MFPPEITVSARLILSLTSAFQEKRRVLVPLAARWNVESLAAAAKRQAARRGGPVNLAWVLMGGVNDGPEEARELGRLFAGAQVRLSVIDVNDPSGRYRRCGDTERGQFLHALSQSGIGFVRRYSGGPDIHAACGMLASTSAPVGAVPPADRVSTGRAGARRRPGPRSTDGDR